VEFDGGRKKGCKRSLTKQGCTKKESANNMVVVLLSLIVKGNKGTCLVLWSSKTTSPLRGQNCIALPPAPLEN